MSRAFSPPTATPAPARASRSRFGVTVRAGRSWIGSAARRSRPPVPGPRASTPRPHAPALLPLGVAVALLAAIETAVLLSQPAAPWQLALFPAAACTWFAGGVVAAIRR